MTILYVETNFLVGAATGRDQDWERLLSRTGLDLTLAIPGVCFLEAMSWMEGEIKRRNQFEQLLKGQMVQLGRDLTSSHAGSLRSLLQQSIVESGNLLSSTDNRLFQAITGVSRSAGAILIGLDADVLELSRNTPVIQELTDNLILHAILGHARSTASERKLFLSGNSREFGTESVRLALREAGVERSFSETSQVLGWLS